MKKIIQAFINIVDFINIAIGGLFSVFFIPLMGLSVFEVISRRILGKPTVWTLEMTRFIFVPIVMMALGYTLLLQGHATIDVFSDKFSPKLKAIVEVFMTAIFLIPSSIVIFMQSFRGAKMSWAILERTPSAFNVAVYPVKALIPLGFALLTLAALSWFLKNLYFLIKNEKIESKIIVRLNPSTDIKDL